MGCAYGHPALPWAFGDGLPGVLQQVAHDRFQLVGVGPRRGQVWRREEGHIDVLLHQYLPFPSKRLLQEVVHVDRPELGLTLPAEGEQVLDNPCGPLSLAQDPEQVLPDLRVLDRVLDQLGIAHDGGEGVVQFMRVRSSSAMRSRRLL